MRMGFFLAPGVHAGTGVLHESCRLCESAVRFDRNHRGAAAAVVGDEQVPSRMVDADVAWTGASGGLLVEQLEVSRVPVDRIRTDTPGSARLTDRVQEPAVRMNLDE